MAASLFWYDFESTGISPSGDRPLQVAGVRTDEDLNEIGTPLNIYCQLSDDVLPHAKACLVTGISPQTVQEQGLSEAEFIKRLHAEVSLPETCTVGFNNLRFDDEMLRYTYWRNFYDPYAREWQGNNSRWDVLDMLRCAYALRPEGIQWPEVDGQVSLRLELLTKANGIDHGHAHEALADVRATIAMARLLKQQQPKLYDYLFNLRRKQAVEAQISLGKPLVHISGRFSAQRHFLSVVLPIAKHPVNRNAWVVVDLHHDISPLLNLSAEQIKQRLYTRRDELAEGELPIPLKLVHINRCPVVAPLSVLRAEDQQRLGLNLAEQLARGEALMAQHSVVHEKLQAVYREGSDFADSDVDASLYQGFLGNRDRNLAQQVRGADVDTLMHAHWPFDDARLPDLLLRYKARNFPTSLTAEEQAYWRAHVAKRLWGEADVPGALAAFKQQWQEESLTAEQQHLQAAWLAYAEQRANQYR